MVRTEEMEPYHLALGERDRRTGDYGVEPAAVGRKAGQDSQGMGLTGAGGIQVDIRKIENFHGIVRLRTLRGRFFAVRLVIASPGGSPAPSPGTTRPAARKGPPGGHNYSPGGGRQSRQRWFPTSLWLNTAERDLCGTGLDGRAGQLHREG